MSRKNRIALADRVASAAEAALAAQHYVSAVDLLIGIRWLEPSAEKRWRQGQIESLEAAMQTNPSRITEAMTLFRSWATNKGLIPSETQYIASTPAREALRFSLTDDPALDQAYRIHWVSPALSEGKRERLAEQANRAPDLIVIRPLNTDWTCHRCGGTGHLLVMENPGPVCLRCAGLDDLDFLPAGDTTLTRRAKAQSKRSAVVVRFSRSRGRYERQGLLVEPLALAAARRGLVAHDTSAADGLAR